MKLSRPQIGALIFVAAATWAISLWIQDAPLDRSHVAPFWSAVGVTTMAVTLFDKFLWSMRWLHGWFVTRPDLKGTWQVELQSDWIDPATGNQVGPIVAYAAVTQTLLSLNLHLMTAESQSSFVAERVSPSTNGAGYQVAAVYTNVPDTLLRGRRSSIHFGALLLETHGQNAGRPEAMSGEYWTTRGTRGKMTLSNRIAALHTRFSDADADFTGRQARRPAA